MKTGFLVEFHSWGRVINAKTFNVDFDGDEANGMQKVNVNWRFAKRKMFGSK